ncbi:putative UDP-N-acetylmuramoylalanyl-D-glutamate-2, 6-diaminopimelate ligase [Peptoniphilus sp. ING2-D1G]|nr:putative UDP-N-acetylmuramoylalanyl-D-glutamate-2, 6-diaminopimelate ligase [Peptoniphilus sp. ING2-D1G]
MLLCDLLKEVERIDFKGTVDNSFNIESICHNSKDASENSLFVAIKGYVTDGHKYIADAKKRGAVIAVVEEFSDVDITQIKVPNSRIALADISKNFYGNSSKKLNVTGITATNGKTTTSFMVDKIYRDAGYKTGIIGTVFTKYADVVIPSILTTPESIELQETFKNMFDEGLDRVTMEVSSSAQELYRVRNIDLDVISFNNFSREHIEQHGSFEKYYEYKSRLIRYAKKDSIAVLNMDFDHIAKLENQTQARVLTYSLENDNYDFSISELDLSTGFGKYKFNILKDIELSGKKIKKQSFNIELNVAGYSSVMNSVAAIIIALANGVEASIIAKSLRTFEGVERRFEMIYDAQFKIIDDHYANVRNIDVTLQTLSKMNYKNLNMLYAIRGSRGVNLNRECAEATSKWLKKLNPKHFYATLSRDAVDEKDVVKDEELIAFKEVMEKNNIECKIFETLKEAINAIIDGAQRDDVVLLAGCQGMDKGAKFAYDHMKNKDMLQDDGKLYAKISERTC